MTVRGAGHTEMNKRGCPQGVGVAQERTLAAQQGRNQRLTEAWRGLLRGTCEASCSVRDGKMRLLGLAEQLGAGVRRGTSFQGGHRAFLTCYWPNQGRGQCGGLSGVR